MSSRIFQGTSAIKLTIRTLANLTDASYVITKFKSPISNITSVDSSIVEAASGVVECIVPATTNIFNELGYWSVWVEIHFSDGSVGYGDAEKVQVIPQGL